jgi:hypothetical protein
VAAAGAALAAATPAPAGAASPVLPNLRELIPPQLTVVRQRDRWSLGFSAIIVNAGPGTLRMVARRDGDEMVADQIVRMDDGSSAVRRGVARLHYERAGGHEHWHVARIVDYSIREVATGRVRRIVKRGFCLGDRRRIADPAVAPPPTAPGVYRTNCGRNRPALRSLVEGISPGYGDVYEAYLHGQALSLSGVHSGRYVLVQRVNPLGVLWETDVGDNASSLLFRLTRPRGGGRPRVRVLRSCFGAAGCG